MANRKTSRKEKCKRYTASGAREFRKIKKYARSCGRSWLQDVPTSCKDAVLSEHITYQAQLVEYYDLCTTPLAEVQAANNKARKSR